MKKYILYFLLFMSPFAIMICINELNRPKILYQIKLFGKSQLAYNSSKYDPNYCNWNCHSNGCWHKEKNSICKGKIIPRIYENIIAFNGIKTTGNNPSVKQPERYKTMNIIFLVFLWPLFMFTLIVFNVEFYLKRKRSKK